MRVALCDAHPFEEESFNSANESFQHEITYFKQRLTLQTAALAQSFPAVCPFVNDELNRSTLQVLKSGGTKLLALRSTGFNHVDLLAAREH